MKEGQNYRQRHFSKLAKQTQKKVRYFKDLAIPPDIPASSLRPPMLGCPVPVKAFIGPPTEGPWGAPISSAP